MGLRAVLGFGTLWSKAGEGGTVPSSWQQEEGVGVTGEVSPHPCHLGDMRRQNLSLWTLSP